MCKIAAITNAKSLTQEQINKIGNLMLSLERDGFGYAVQGREGIFGEKCVAPHFKSRMGVGNILDLPIVAHQYETFGKPTAPIGPAIFHGRTSTNVQGLRNCHPMQLNGHHLIHNGVVTDHGPKYTKATENDSEDVLYRFLQGIGEVEKHLSGYYAFASIDPQGQLHIVRDDTATLYIAWSDAIDSYIIATTDSLVRRIGKILKAKVTQVDPLNSNVYGIFRDNEMVHFETIRPKGFSYTESKYAERSLGHSLPGNTIEDTPYQLGDTEADLKSRGINSREEAYYEYMSEVDNMDASYQIYNTDGTEINLVQFRKMDYISQELCTIIRPDGTLLCPEGELRRKSQ